MTLTSLLPLIALALPIIGGLAALGAGRRNRRLGIAVVAGTAVTTFLITALLALAAKDGLLREMTLVQIAPPVWIVFRIDPLGTLFAATVSGLFLLALIYAFGYLPDDRRQWRFHAFAMACQGCMIGVAFAGNLVTLLVFYELFSLLSYPLITHDRTRVAVAAGLKYLVYIITGGAFVWAGIILVFHLGGEIRFLPGGLADINGSPGLVLATFACLVTGFGVKAALMPLHGWVPDAHPAAPAPFSAVLSGVMVATGVFGILRVMFEIFGVSRLIEMGVLPWLGGIAGASVLLAAARAVGEDDLKRRLAWSTISQMAYVLMAVSTIGGQAVTGAFVHITHHAFLKGGLFFCAGLVATVTGATRISQLRGLAQRMPVTSLALTVLALGLVGIPPLSGFISKWLLGLGLADAGAMVRLGVMLAGALLAAVYLWPIIYRIWLPTDDPRFAHSHSREASGWMLGILIATGMLAVILGTAATLPGFPLDLAKNAAQWLVEPPP
ncbi:MULTISPECIES: complex I subunit 5 family protein [unclassified Wenzhouxiangella]|uniref:complex I subunit 5 family protein n=1 Tax=unclassified Wenzhouxiangella TaxID=2613841 RepID=UPI000E32643D|nr:MULTISPECIES: proton-conducting transporter membrane subunit [unclassified Wenzhouxiangella]RFF28034.1 oxidoreductase [Wenzhouxiangella sp. 15181]RFP68620.1 oxidoreductase [Wenzhouxiangella sp. 15190]